VAEFTCQCGKRLKVQDDLAGKTVRCPVCRETIEVPEPVDGAEALQAAMRELQQSETAPVAEVVEEPLDPQAADGLDALAQMAGPSKSSGKPSAGRGRKAAKTPPRGATVARKPGKASKKASPTPPRGRKVAREPGRPVPPGAAPNGKGRSRRKQAMIVGGFAAAGVILIIIIVAVAVGDRETDPPPRPAQTYVPSASDQPKRRGPFTGHQPGELFGHVPFADEKEDGAGEDNAERP